MLVKKPRNMFSKADDRLKKLVWTPSEFKRVFSELKDLQVKFYWITILIFELENIIEIYNNERIKLCINNKDIENIVAAYSSNRKVNVDDFRHLTTNQIKLIVYISNSYLPFVMKEYSKLVIKMRESINESDYRTLNPSDIFYTFNYNARVILKYLDDVVKCTGKQLIYLHQLISKLYVDIKKHIYPDIILKPILEIDKPMIENAIMQINVLNNKSLNFRNVPESGEYEVLVNSSKKKTVETELLEEDRNTISNTDKIICINTETKLRKFLVLLQEYDIIENILEKDEKLLKYLSVFLKSDFHNYNSEEIKQIQTKPIRLKIEESNIIYLIGKLFKSEYNQKYIFEGTDIWHKVSKVIRNKRGGKLNPKSMCTRYSKMRLKKIIPYNIENLEKIISIVHYTK